MIAECGGGGGGTANNNNNNIRPAINRALWPRILERAHKTSAGIYDNIYVDSMEEKKLRKCATGLFDLLHHEFFAEDHRRREYGNCEILVATVAVAVAPNIDAGNDALKRKREREHCV